MNTLLLNHTERQNFRWRNRTVLRLLAVFLALFVGGLAQAATTNDSTVESGNYPCNGDPSCGILTDQPSPSASPGQDNLSTWKGEIDTPGYDATTNPTPSPTPDPDFFSLWVDGGCYYNGGNLVGKQITVTIDPTPDVAPDPAASPTTYRFEVRACDQNSGCFDGKAYPQGPLVAQGEATEGSPGSASFQPAQTAGACTWYYVDVFYVSGGEPNSTDASSPSGQHFYSASAKVGAIAGPATTRSATYTTGGGIKFSNNVTVKAPGTVSDGNPNDRTDVDGNHYVSGMRGSDPDLWYFDLNPGSTTFDPNLSVPLWRGNIASANNSFGPQNGYPFDGYFAMAVGFGSATSGQPPLLAMSELYQYGFSGPNGTFYAYNGGAPIDVQNSPDTGLTIVEGTPLQSGYATFLEPQQWEEFLGTTTVYMDYRLFVNGNTNQGRAYIARSDDGGLTFSTQDSGVEIGHLGPVDVDQTTGVVCFAGSTGNVACGAPPQSPSPTPSATAAPPASPLFSPAVYAVSQAASDPNGVAHSVFVSKIADDGAGTVYAVYSNGHDIFLTSSSDAGKTWLPPVRVNTGATKTNIFPWIETGKNAGSVGIVWYGTTSATNSQSADWKVYYAFSANATDPNPAFVVADVNEPEHFVHAGSIEDDFGRGDNNGNKTSPSPTPRNHNLFDYIQLSFDPQGAAVVSFADDHNDYSGNIYVARQIAGKSINGTALAAQTAGSDLANAGANASASASPNGDVTPPPQPGDNGEQVTDFADDGPGGPKNTSEEIISIKYSSVNLNGTLGLRAQMKVGAIDMSNLPPSKGTTWQMNFTFNAPHSVVAPTGDYTFGLSDRGNQFWVAAHLTIDHQPKGEVVATWSYLYGTATRDADGGIKYTVKGEADAGSVNPDDGTITVDVSVDKLNAALPAGADQIGDKSVAVGLRGEITKGPNLTHGGGPDATRGGTQFALDAGVIPVPVQLKNISSRAGVGTNDNVLIGGWIITGAPMHVVIRGLGPSLTFNGAPIAGRLMDPILTLVRSSGDTITTNDKWQSGDNAAEITSLGLAPTSADEAAIDITLDPGSYTAVLQGVGGTTGIGQIEVYDVDVSASSGFADLSSRGFCGTGDNVFINGIIIQGDTAQNVLWRAIGPDLGTERGVPGALQDPVMTVFNSNGVQTASNDSWRSTQEAQIVATGLAPDDDRDAAILQTLGAGNYTAVISGKGGTTGIVLGEVYNLGNPPTP